MANENVNQPAPAELFTMSAKYLICPNGTPGQLLNDASCLLDSALGVLMENHNELTSWQWASVYLLQQAKSMHDRAQSMLIQAGAITD
jgi:hypothetical protein